MRPALLRYRRKLVVLALRNVNVLVADPVLANLVWCRAMLLRGSIEVVKLVFGHVNSLTTHGKPHRAFHLMSLLFG